MAYEMVSETPAATGGHNVPRFLDAWDLGRTPPAGPKFRFNCTVGCPLPAPVCHDVLRAAILDAIDLASNAAKKLQQGTTGVWFKLIFGDEASVFWAPNMQAGAVVARRFRKVAAALQERGTLYRCVSACPSSCEHPPILWLYVTLTLMLSLFCAKTRYGCAHNFGSCPDS